MQDTVQKIINLLRDQYSDGPFKAFYDGDPDVIPAFNLPALSVAKLDDETRLGPTGMDRIEEHLVIKVILDKKSDWSAKSDEVRLVERRIRELVERRDEETGDYASGTIKGQLRRHMTMDGMRISGDMRFDIGSLPRPNDTITAEGHLFITVNTTMRVANRS